MWKVSQNPGTPRQMESISVRMANVSDRAPYTVLNQTFLDHMVLLLDNPRIAADGLVECIQLVPIK